MLFELDYFDDDDVIFDDYFKKDDGVDFDEKCEDDVDVDK